MESCSQNFFLLDFWWWCFCLGFMSVHRSVCFLFPVTLALCSLYSQDSCPRVAPCVTPGKYSSVEGRRGRRVCLLLLLFHPTGSSSPFSTPPRAHALPHPKSPQGRGDSPNLLRPLSPWRTGSQDLVFYLLWPNPQLSLCQK